MQEEQNLHLLELSFSLKNTFFSFQMNNSPTEDMMIQNYEDVEESVIWIKSELQTLDGKLDVISTENLQLLKGQLCNIHESLQMLNDLAQAKKQIIEESCWDVFIACATQDQQQVYALMKKLERHYGVKCTSSCYLAPTRGLMDNYGLDIVCAYVMARSRYIMLFLTDAYLHNDLCQFMSKFAFDIQIDELGKKHSVVTLISGQGHLSFGLGLFPSIKMKEATPALHYEEIMQALQQGK